ncbi:MAG: YidC/Oxa1 family membrane protein insertase [Actinomycetota bacterium]|nr:YidC/Oxa1 family membrane protein insertase [Actinomycetota bacterium]
MMLATIPVISPLFQDLLNAIGWALAFVFHVVPNYGFAIIAVTILLRVLVLPLGIKQMKSMSAMQTIQPKLAEIKKKYKGNNAKIQEETMRLYKEAGVNPLGGCLPLLLQFPILITMYAVTKPPQFAPVTPLRSPAAYNVMNNHLPISSTLFRDVVHHENTDFLWVLNLQCSAATSGRPAEIRDNVRPPGVIAANAPVLSNGAPIPTETPGQELTITKNTYDCGSGIPSKIPYLVLLALMIGTTFLQQVQMQRVSPPGAASQQQQTIMKVMPLMFAFIGFSLPAGVILYWTVTNLFMIGQQSFLLRAGHIGPEAMERQIAQQRAKQASQPETPERKGWLASMMERANQERLKGSQTPPPKSAGGRDAKPRKPGTGGGTRSGTGKGGSAGRSNQRKPTSGQKRPKKPGSGGKNGS